MRNKRGFFMAMYLVFLTLVMCALSLVSPVEVLEVREDLDIIEMRER